MRSLDQILERRQADRRGLHPAGTRKPLEMMQPPRAALRHHLRHPELEPAGLPADELAAIIAELGQGPGGLRRPRPALGHDERLPAGHLQPGGAGHGLAHPHLRPQAGTELDRGRRQRKAQDGLVGAHHAARAADYRGGILYRRLRPGADPDLGASEWSNLFETINKIISSPLWMLAAVRHRSSASVVLWLALVFWTFKDARKRIDDPIIVGVAVLTSLVLPVHGHRGLRHPAAGGVPGRGAGAGTRDAGHGAGAADPARLSHRAASSSGPTIVACPSCRRPLRAACPSCDRVLEPGWKLCPYCGHDLKARAGAAAGWTSRTGAGSVARSAPRLSGSDVAPPEAARLSRIDARRRRWWNARWCWSSPTGWRAV